MDQETLFTGSKWNILESLSTSKKSPLELAQESGTSIANISQQLRLLEMAGLVVSERISNRDKGKPRILYRLNGDNAFLISTASNYVNKGFVELSPLRQALLGAWLIPTKAASQSIEQFILRHADRINNIQAVYLDKTNPLRPSIGLVLSDNSSQKTFASRKTDTLPVSVVSKKQASGLLPAQFEAVYDPLGIFNHGGNL